MRHLQRQDVLMFRMMSENVGSAADSKPGRPGTGAGRAAGRAPVNGKQEQEQAPEKGTATMDGFRRLIRTITAETPLDRLPVDLEESEILNVLEELESCDLRVFDAESSNAQRLRANLRYLAALWPEASVAELAQRIHALINNRNIVFSDVMTVLRGERLSERTQLDDLRTVLRGGSLGDASRVSREVPVPVIQGIGRCLRDGMSMAETARSMRVSVDTVRNIERVLGLRAGYKQRLLSAAVDAVRDGVSVREFARTHNVSKSTAEGLLREGRAVLVELGEAE